MGIKNRKQIPVCQGCHLQIIHKGKYGGNTALSYFRPKIMYENRLITIEGKISRTNNTNDGAYVKTLEEKGWTRIGQKQSPIIYQDQDK